MRKRTTGRRVSALILAAAVVGIATACASVSDDAAQPGPPESTPSSTPADAGTPSPAGDASAMPTCDTLIGASTVAVLTNQGWTARQSDFAFGPDIVPGGLQCLWADASTASDNGLLYGWAPLSAEDAASAQETLLSQGWVKEDAASGVYITADPQFAMGKDDDGYGMTYLFGDGWVTVSDTKQGLLLIDRPE
ncbi:hypothetical protein GCM10025768_12540 [Microbacterium pseudoresistens]|uniref:Nitrate ABC transporter substrate-binding protein n=1 Tax=Microbacterium pseudoresistens TaxID=640634 RepID=A0A7Y9EWC9_9MICO|nr:hypothetical protein [Microbacterium pseudoresistens]NYD55157.1 hypothetical protein [Microbacterium pseudoresistens]